MNQLEKIGQEYFTLLNLQKFNVSELDYKILDEQIPFLNQMAKVKNSGISIFDMHQKKHLFNSYNLENLFGYDLKKISEIGNDYYNSRIHPKDMLALMKIGVFALKYSYNLPISERKNFKLQNEYRILNAQDQYIRIIEQFQTLELDNSGNFWLTLSVIDISPNQDEYEGVRSQLVNIKTGEAKVIEQESNILDSLSKREKEILTFVKSGLLSKEISENLSISVHTVNTHRQNILKKLNANNSIEAIEYAKQRSLA